MSLVPMTNVAFARRSDTAPPVPKGASEVNSAAHGAAAPHDAITDALGVIIAYFPAEINVLYAAVVAALVANDTRSLAGQWVAFWFILALTPVAVWFVYAARVKAAGKLLP